MNGDETAWQLVAKCKQSEKEFLAFAGAGGMWSCSTACEGTRGSFPKHPDGSLRLWLLKRLEKCITAASNCMESLFLPTQSTSENLRGKSWPVNKHVALSPLCATRTQEVVLQLERFLFFLSLSCKRWAGFVWVAGGWNEAVSC